MPQAIHSDHFQDFRVAVKEADDQPIELKEEQALFDMSEMGGWKVLKEYITELKEILDKILQSSMESGSSFEEIGQKTIVTTLAKSYLDQVIERVENAREAIATK